MKFYSFLIVIQHYAFMKDEVKILKMPVTDSQITTATHATYLKGETASKAVN